MTANINSIAFLGSREDVWHRIGTEMPAGADLDQWITSAGLDWEAIPVPAIAALEGPRFDHLDPSTRFRRVDGQCFIVRSDTGHPLGYVSDGYQVVQPSEVISWFHDYVLVDSRFSLDVAGALGAGEKIWATAKFNGGLEIAGEAHSARVLMSTSFDATKSTINQMTCTRVVCQNTLNLAHADKRAQIKTTHRAKFDARQVARELAQLAQSVEAYKRLGDAMAVQKMDKREIRDFFLDILDIPRETKSEDLSTRTRGRYEALAGAYRTSVHEGAAAGTVWSALQAVTRYVDHDRSVRGGDSEQSQRDIAANFGSGDALKGKAVGLLMPLVNDRVPVLIPA